MSDTRQNAMAYLRMQYESMRAELVSNIRANDANFRTGILMITGLSTAAVLIKDARPVFLVPTMMFVVALIHLIKTAGCNALGVYCQAVEQRLREMSSRDEGCLPQWEGSAIWQASVSPRGLVFWGFYLLSVPLLGMFCAISYYAYCWKWWTLPVHATEMVVFAVYAFFTIALNDPDRRQVLVEAILSQSAVRTEDPETSTAVKAGGEEPTS